MKKSNIMVNLVVVCVILLVMVGLLLAGVTVGERGVRQAQQQHESVEARILAFIIEKNPEATIRDFGDFPKVLLEESERAGLDYRLVLAIADKESQFNPKAVSYAGAVGLLQLMPATAQLMVKHLNLEGYDPPRFKSGKLESLGSLADPKINLRLGIAYFKTQVDRFDRIAVALRAYNRPPDKAREHRPGDRYAEDITLAYVDIVRKLPR